MRLCADLETVRTDRYQAMRLAMRNCAAVEFWLVHFESAEVPLASPFSGHFVAHLSELTDFESNLRSAAAWASTWHKKHGSAPWWRDSNPDRQSEDKVRSRSIDPGEMSKPKPQEGCLLYFGFVRGASCSIDQPPLS